MVSTFGIRIFKSLLWLIPMHAPLSNSFGQSHEIHTSGAMRNVMMRGQLEEAVK